MIEALEAKIEETNKCLFDPACYDEKGLVELSQTLKEDESRLEEMVEKYLLLEEKVQGLENS
jgi:ATP-binding cassette subfamily F protein uup